MTSKGRGFLIGGVFVLARDPAALADWYTRHLGWQLRYMPDENTYYTELYYSSPDAPDDRRHVVYAIMPGDPGQPGTGHIVNYRVDNIDAVLTSLNEAGVETSGVTVGPDADGDGMFARLQDPEGHLLELWQHL